ncbi:MAG: hypothetical protein EA397_12775 [Deltaproteobacteria bacterium]|nr:MAG: hypothetical protein EA397_12775 [Deltaproteobacteria bacterium]
MGSRSIGIGVLTWLVLAGCNGDGGSVSSDSSVDTGTDTPAGPRAPTLLLEPAEPRTGDRLVVQVIQPDAGVRFEYAWTRDGETVDGLTSDQVPSAETAKGETWEAIVTPFAGSREGTAGTSSVVILNTPPELTAAWEDTEPASDSDLVVTFSTADEDDDDVTVSWSWSLNGDPTSHDGPIVPRADLERGQEWTVVATPNDGEEDGDPVTLTTEIGNGAPSIASVVLGPELAYTNTTLIAEVSGVEDPDGDDVSLSYTFIVEGVEVQSSDDNSLEGRHFSKGDTVYVVVTPSDEEIDGEPATSNEIVILNSAPELLSVTLDPDPARTLDDIRITFEANDPDGDDLTLVPTWTLDDEVIAFDGLVLPHGETVRGNRIMVDAYVTDSDLDSETQESQELTIANTPPTRPGIAVAPNPAIAGSDITCSVVAPSEDPDDDAITYSFTWSVNGTPFVDAVHSESESTVPGDSVGDDENWICTVVASDELDESEPATAATSTDPFTCVEVPFAEWTGSGTTSSPYVIQSVEAFDAIRDAEHCRFRLGEDVDLDGFTWTQIEEFSGSLDGNGHTIRNLTLDEASSTDGTALFLNLSGTVENLTFSGFDVRASRYASMLARNVLGGAVIRNLYGDETNVVFSNRNAVAFAQLIEPEALAEHLVYDGAIEQAGLSSQTAGLFSFIDGHVRQVAFRGTIHIEANGPGSSHNTIGGIAVFLRDGGLLEEAAFTGTISGHGTRVGGLIGRVNDGAATIRDCYVDATIDGHSRTHGVAGDRQSGAITLVENTYLATEMSISTPGSGAQTGIAGDANGRPSWPVTEVHWATDLAGVENPGENVTGDNPVMAAELVGSSLFDAFSSDIWVFSDTDYPRLRWMVDSGFGGDSGDSGDNSSTEPPGDLEAPLEPSP